MQPSRSFFFDAVRAYARKDETETEEAGELSDPDGSEPSGDGDGAYIPKTETQRKARSFLEQLNDWRRMAQQGSLADLIWDIYRKTGYFDFVGGLPGGQQRQANLRALYDRSRQYEATSFRGLFRFCVSLNECKTAEAIWAPPGLWASKRMS